METRRVGEPALPEGFEKWVHEFLQPMVGAGYKPRAIEWCRWALAHLGQWMQCVAVPLAELDESILTRFQKHLPVCRCPGRRSPVRSHPAWVVRPVRRLLAYLRSRGVVITQAPVGPPGAWEHPILGEFRSWMLRHRGVKEVSVERHRLVLVRLLQVLGEDLRAYTAESLRGFVIREVQSGRSHKPKAIVGAVRMFIRWAVATGRCSSGLPDAVPAVAQWSLASLPQPLPEADVDRLIAACDVTTASGIRDRAILLLLARLGLRAGDIAALRLDDIDWSGAALRVLGKARRETWLPLPQEVGDALLAYLRRRPATSFDKVFLRSLAPVQPLSGTNSVSSVVKWALRRAKIAKLPLRRGGARALRHSVATSMLRQGATLQEVGKLLRHESIDTTAIYAKVDVERLRQVAQPWPGVTTC